MRILGIADVEDNVLYGCYRPGILSSFDMLISAGDLRGEYLSFLVTMANRPLFYVPGNHDGRYEQRPPEGCECIDGRIINYNGVRILGLGGSMLYSGGPHQYSERQMRRRIRRLRFQLWRSGGVDIVVSHAPVAGFGDMNNMAHRGFECFRDFIEKYQPKLWIHGHVHKSYGHQFLREHKLGDTRIVNVYSRWIMDI